MNKVAIGILGFGVVGQGTYEALCKSKKDIKLKSGQEIVVKKICDLNISSKADRQLFTKDAADILQDDEIKIVVELIGGVNFAFDFIKKALMAKKHVVTANKHLLAKHGNELFDLACKNGVLLLAEAAVCGAIPCLRTIRKSAYSLQIDKVQGILNGTANYILTSLQHKGGVFVDVLKKAQKLGYAESDPTFDIEGIDAAHKIAILSAFAFGVEIDFANVDIQGISKLIPEDFDFAKGMGCKIKLVGSAEKHQNKIYLSVRPVLVKKYSKLGQVDGVMNAVLLNSSNSGPILMEGAGAGGLATGTAVVSDIIECALFKDKQSLPFQKLSKIPSFAFNELEKRSVVRIVVKDAVGILAKVSKIFADENISILNAHQSAKKNGDRSNVVISFLLDCSQIKKVEKAAHKIADFSFVKTKPIILTIEE